MNGFQWRGGGFVAACLLAGVGIGSGVSTFLRPGTVAYRDDFVPTAGSRWSGPPDPALNWGDAARAAPWSSASLPEPESRETVDFFPPGPLQNAIVVNHQTERNVEIPHSLEPSAPLQLAAEPQPLKIDAEEAQPLSAADDARAARIRAIIDAELPGMPAAERDIWLESLRDMGDQDAAGVLRMWKQFGPPPKVTAEISIPDTSPPQQLSIPETADDPREGEHQSIDRIAREAIAIHRRNILSHSVPGYVPQLPELLEERDGEEIQRSIRSSPVFRTELRETGFPLDVAIEGRGLFAVRDRQGREYYTRWGRFSLDEDRHLTLAIGAKSYVVQPPLAVLEHTTRLTVQEDGSVTVELSTPGEDGEPGPLTEAGIGSIMLAWPLSGNALSYAGNGLFRITDEGRRTLTFGTPGAAPFGALRSGFLSAPTVNIAEERAAIARWESLLAPAAVSDAFVPVTR